MTDGEIWKFMIKYKKKYFFILLVSMILISHFDILSEILKEFI